MEVEQGQIYKVLFKKKSRGSHLQCGIRPAIVVSGNRKNRGEIIDVVPLTSVKKRKDLGTHVVVKGYGLERRSIALIEQTTIVDKNSICEENYIGTIDDKELMDKIISTIKEQYD